MPGMLETVLNVGLTPAAARELLTEGWRPETVEMMLSHLCESLNVTHASQLGDITAQVCRAVERVHSSLNSPHATAYARELGGVEPGQVAVLLQHMVFGNRSSNAGTGVVFSRNPQTGIRELYGEWLDGSQGPSLVSGETSPRTLTSLRLARPDLFSDLLHISQLLEQNLHDMQDIEFTFDEDGMYILQTRPGKRTDLATVVIALDLWDEGAVSADQVRARLQSVDMRTIEINQQRLSPDLPLDIVARGVGACPGVITGTLVSNLEEIESLTAQGKSAILARPATSPSDIPAFLRAAAVVTEVGGSTSHAAVVSRELNLPCVVGCGSGSIMPLLGSEVTLDGGEGVLVSPTKTPLAHNQSLDEYVSRAKQLMMDSHFSRES